MRELAGDRVEVYSAGSHPAGYVHPLAVETMAEVGIDVSVQQSKGLDALPAGAFDYVVTVCDHARQACPTLAGRIATYHWPMEDPVATAAGDSGAMDAARRVRDALKNKLAELLGEWGIGGPRGQGG